MRTTHGFLAYLEGTPQARALEEKAAEWSAKWLRKQTIAPSYRELLANAGGNPTSPTRNRAAWEVAVHGLRAQFADRDLGIRKTDLFRIADANLVATNQDFRFSFDQRKLELLRHWQDRDELAPFWQEPIEIDGTIVSHAEFRRATGISDENFCKLCQQIQLWVARENSARRPELRMAKGEVVGLRPSENYDDPADGPRIATIYNGLSGRARFVPFRKGDPEGNRYCDNTPLFIDWSQESVDYLSTSTASRWQGTNYFFTHGFSWTRGANQVAIKAKLLEPGVFDVNAMKLSMVYNGISAPVILAVLNSDIFSFFLKRFIAHTWMAQLNDLRQMPLVIPTPEQHQGMEDLARLCIEAKRTEFTNDSPSNELVARTRNIGEALRSNAPSYLHPGAQDFLLATPRDCLAVLENAVNWEAEKLYGVEGLGPFDEF